MEEAFDIQSRDFRRIHYRSRWNRYSCVNRCCKNHCCENYCYCENCCLSYRYRNGHLNLTKVSD